MRANYTETEQNGCSNECSEINFGGIHEWVLIDSDGLEEFIKDLQKSKWESEKEKK